MNLKASAIWKGKQMRGSVSRVTAACSSIHNDVLRYCMWCTLRAGAASRHSEPDPGNCGFVICMILHHPIASPLIKASPLLKHLFALSTEKVTLSDDLRGLALSSGFFHHARRTFTPHGQRQTKVRIPSSTCKARHESLPHSELRLERFYQAYTDP